MKDSMKERTLKSNILREYPLLNVDGIMQYLLMMKDNNEQEAAAGAYHEPTDKPGHNYHLRNKTQGSQQVKMMTKYHTSLLLRAKWTDCFTDIYQ